MSAQNSYEILINHFGSQQKTADALGCSQPAVCKWVQKKARMSAPLAIKAERLTGGKVKAVNLCPDLACLDDPYSNNTTVKS